jgi:hypothetical protein
MSGWPGGTASACALRPSIAAAQSSRSAQVNGRNAASGLGVGSGLGLAVAGDWAVKGGSSWKDCRRDRRVEASVRAHGLRDADGFWLDRTLAPLTTGAAAPCTLGGRDARSPRAARNH